MTDAEPPECGQMVVVESPELLPLGWTVKVEEVKFYYNVITGQKFYSKADLLRYVALGSPSQGTRQRTRAQSEGNTENRLMLMPTVTEKTPEWLPQGWIVQLNAVSNGQKYKTYIDPSSGRKFNSKPAILKYLNSDECTDPAAKQMAMSIVSAINVLPVGTDNPPEWLPQGWIMELDTTSSGRKFKRYINPTGQKFYSKPEVMRYLKSCESKDPSSDQTALSIVSDINSIGRSSTPNMKQMCSRSSKRKRVKVVRYEDKRLPPGWIKEIRFEWIGNKTRKDPYYTDPVSKYVFRSFPDALRYLETKDISACIIKPKKREDLEFLTDDISLHISEQNQVLLLDNNTTEECTPKEETLSPTRDECTEKEENLAPTLEEFTEKEVQLAPTLEECIEKQENLAPSPSHMATTPGSKRKRGKPVAAPSSPSNKMPQEKPVEVSIDSTKSDGVQVIPEEGTIRGDGVNVKGKNQDLEPQRRERLGGDSNLYPRLKYAFKTLRGDIPVEANNLAAQGYNHHQRASLNVGLPSFSDYARRQM